MDPYEQFLNAQGADALLGNQPTGNQQEMDTNPLLTAGLGGAAAFQGMFPFAGEAAANSRGTTLPQLIGTGNSQFTGTNAGRLTQGTQIVPQTQLSTINQLPAVQSSGSLSNKTTTAKPGTADYKVNRPSPYTMGPFKSLLGTLTKGLVGSLAVAPNEMGDATIGGAFNRAVEAGEDPAAAAARLGIEDTSIRGLDPSNREVDFMSDGTGVLNAVPLFTGKAASTGSNYADLVNADRARSELLSRPSPEEDTFVEPLDFAGEIQNNPEPYSGLVDNNPFTALGGTPVEENPYTVAQAGLTPEERARIETRLARTNADIVASGETVGGAPQEGFVSRLAGRLGEQFTQPAPYTPLPGGAESETAFGATPTQPTLFRDGLSAISELNKTPLTSPDSYSTKAPEAIYGDGNLPALSPQSLAEQGSPQAFFEEYRSKGPLTPEQIARGEAEAARMGTTFDPDTGFSRDPFLQFQQAQQGRVAPSQALSGVAPMGVEETRARLGGRTLNEYLNAPDGTPGVSGLRTDPQGRMIPAGFETRANAYPSYEDFAAEREGRLAARMQQPGESITERDTRIAAERTQSSQNVPTDVREAMLTPEGRRTAKQINRLARWGGSTQGQEMGGVAGLEQSLQPVDAQKQQYDAMRAYKLGLEIDKMQQEKPSEYQESAAEVDEAIAAGSIKPEDRNKFILRDLGWQAKGGEDSSDLMSIIYGDATGSGGEPTLVKTQEEYDNLAKGTRYIDADGNIATKK